MKKGTIVTLTTHILTRADRLPGATVRYTIAQIQGGQYELIEHRETEQVRIVKVQRDGTIWYTPLALEAQGLAGQYCVRSDQTIAQEA